MNERTRSNLFDSEVMSERNGKRLVVPVGGQTEVAGIVSEVAPEVNFAVVGQGGAVRVAGADLDDLAVQFHFAWKT